MSWLRDRGRLTVVFVAALAVGHLLVGLWLLPGWLFGKYPDAAKLWAEGRLGATAAGDYSPLYLWINRALSPGVLRAVQSVLGATLVPAVFLTGRRLFGVRAAIGAAVLTAVASMIHLYEATLEPDLLIAVLQAWALVFAAARGPGGSGAPRLKHLIIGGALAGLAAAARPSGLCLVGALSVWWALGGGARGLRTRRVAVFVTSAVAAVAVPTLALRLGAGADSAATMSAGAVLHLSNRPEGTGLGAQPPYLLKMVERQEAKVGAGDLAHDVYRRFAARALGRELSSAEAQRYWVGKALRFPLARPGAFAALLARKAAFFFHGPDAHDIAEVRRAATGLPSWLLGSRVLTLLGLFGLAVAFLERRPGAWLLAGTVVAALMLVLVFYLTSRYRLAVLPAFCVLGGAGLAAVSRMRGLRDVMRLGVAGFGPALVVALTPFVGDAARVVERGAEASLLMRELEASRRARDLETATAHFAEAQAAQPFVTLTQDLRGIPLESRAVAVESGRLAVERWGAERRADEFMLAVLAMRAGRCEAALEPLVRLGREGLRSAVFDRSVDPLLLAAECELGRGRRAEAAVLARESVLLRPGTLDALAFLVAGRQDPDGALERELLDLHDPLSAAFALARAHLMWGTPERALVELERLGTWLPDVGAIKHLRARALLALGRDDEALAAYAAAQAAHPTYPFSTGEFEAAFERARLRAPDDLKLAALYVEHLVRGGRLTEARAVAGPLSPSMLSAWVVELLGARPPAGRWFEAAQNSLGPRGER